MSQGAANVGLKLLGGFLAILLVLLLVFGGMVFLEELVESVCSLTEVWN